MADYKQITPHRQIRLECENSNSSATHRKRVEWVDTLKVLTLIGVVLMHSSYYTIHSSFGGVENLPADVGERSFLYRAFAVIIGGISRFAMPLFMAASGAVFSWSMGKFSTLSTLIHNKAKRLLMPFLWVMTFVSVPIKYLAGYWDHSTHVLSDILCGQYLLLGNSHLWFVVSLFYIFVVFYLLEKSNVRKNISYWGILLGLSWLATILNHFLGQSLGTVFGLYGLLRYLFFFAIGFSTFKYWDEINPLSWNKQVLSWAGYFYIIAMSLPLWSYGNFAIKAVLSFPMDSALALWGCTNMVCLARSIDRCIALKSSTIYRFMNRYNYELYLYSEPFTYVLIAWIVSWFGQSLFTENTYITLAYIIRFFGQIFFATGVIWMVNLSKHKRIHLSVKVE